MQKAKTTEQMLYRKKIQACLTMKVIIMLRASRSIFFTTTLQIFKTLGGAAQLFIYTGCTFVFLVIFMVLYVYIYMYIYI